MCKAEQLLEAIVSAEDAGLEHAEACIVCRTSLSKSECPTATSIAMESIVALLDAKMYLDSAERTGSPHRVTS